MIEEIYSIERQAMGKSPVHSLDARIKIILAFSAIIAMVAYPYTTDVIIPGVLFLIFFTVLWLFSGISISSYLKRVVLILPFGFFIIFFQIFFENSHYTTFTPLVTLPLNIHIYAESVEFAYILFIKFIVCISFIILLSSTTTMQDLLTGARRLGLPSEFALVIGLMIRYLFVFADILGKMKNVFDTRFFNAFDRNLPYKYRLKTIAYAVGTMFIRSYEQGERTYLSMLCRGYSKDSYLHVGTKKLTNKEIFFLSFSLAFIVAVPVLSYIYSNAFTTVLGI
ncbi:cobalt/nickel transport system permease protein [Methanomicrobium sp. W14]|uniref:cobalt ECF transporter T component CbiQ n=1 Tax=Methanomicrobium sp. W14 TaxID=2817839 RepID=UPI001AEAC672|nr:cobalt ECF transporter T component CbiQ [Methanomicrobium sp. W14]MBP2132887.1 cobalt/nickel transport system permease protein [Methanomicrobium sp. W14]